MNKEITIVTPRTLTPDKNPSSYFPSKDSGGALTDIFSALNIRLSNNVSEDEFVANNEKGTTAEISTVKGFILGYCSILKYLVVFSHEVEEDVEKPDHIYLITLDEITEDNPDRESKMLGIKELHNGKLNFSTDHLIETVASVERRDIIKVYWVDGLNPFRLINILEKTAYNDLSFDSVPDFNGLFPEISVRVDSGSGQFTPCKVQYLITYYNLHMQETNPVAISSPVLVRSSGVAQKADESAYCNIKIKLKNASTSKFDYLRIYRIDNLSKEGSANCYIVKDIIAHNVPDEIEDTNNNLTAIDITEILPSSSFSAYTATSSNDTMFLGNITVSDVFDVEKIKDILSPYHLGWRYKNIPSRFIEDFSSVENSTVENSEIATFKKGEYYRFGIEFYDRKGSRSGIIYIGDVMCPLAPICSFDSDSGQTPIVYKDYNDEYYRQNNSNLGKLEQIEEEGNEIISGIPVDFEEEYNPRKVDRVPEVYLKKSFFDSCRREGINYHSYRLYFAYASPSQRRVYAQGVVSPTMFNVYDRAFNKPTTIPSYIFRPVNSEVANEHYQCTPPYFEDNAEIASVTDSVVPFVKKDAPLRGSESYVFDSFVLLLYADAFADNASKVRLRWAFSEYNSYDLEYLDLSNSELNTLEKIEGFSTIVKEYRAIQSPSNEEKAGFTIAIKTVYDSLPDEDKEIAKKAIKDTDFKFYFNEDDGRVYGSGLVSSEVDYKDDYDGALNEVRSGLFTALNGIFNAKGKNNYIGINQLPSTSTLRNMVEFSQSSTNTGDILAITGATLLLVASIVLSVFTYGAATPAAVGAGALLSTVIASSAVSLCVAATVASASFLSVCIEKLYENTSPEIKQILKEGLIPLNGITLKGDRFIKKDYSLLMDMFFKRLFSTNFPLDYEAMDKGVTLLDEGVVFALTGMSNPSRFMTKEYIKKGNNLYVDNAVVTFNSPDIKDLYHLDKRTDISLDVVGRSFIDYNGHNTSLIIDKNGLSTNNRTIPDPDTYDKYDKHITNGYYYQDCLLGYNSDEHEFKPLPNVVKYKQFMWHRDSSVGGYWHGINLKDTQENIVNTPHSTILKKTFSNYLYAERTLYFNNGKTLNVDDVRYISTEGNSSPLFHYKHNGEDKSYYANVDMILNPHKRYLIPCDDNGSKIYLPNNETVKDDENLACNDATLIRYRTYNHLLFPLSWRTKDVNGNDVLPDSIIPTILPTPNSDFSSTIVNLYSGQISTLSTDVDKASTYSYLNHNAKYSYSDGGKFFHQDILPDYTTTGKRPLVLVCDVIRNDFDVDKFMGGNDESTLKNHQWVASSGFIPFEYDEYKKYRTYGDTFFQRCSLLKTQPYSEEEKNGVVEKMSIMLETRIDVRSMTDRQYGFFNSISSRDHNHNQPNPVYQGLDVIYPSSYIVKDDRKVRHFGNFVYYSTPKIDSDTIDTFSKIKGNSFVRMNSSFGSISKVVTVMNAPLVFQERGISSLRFNERALLGGKEGMPLEIANSTRVSGYDVITNSNGALSKEAVLVSSGGLFFVDAINRSLFTYTKDKGFINIGKTSFNDSFFKKHAFSGVSIVHPVRLNESSVNIPSAILSPKTLRLYYDDIVGMLYMINEDVCYGYSPTLQGFVSYYSYNDFGGGVNFITNLMDKSLILTPSLNGGTESVVSSMFTGDYNNILGKDREYNIVLSVPSQGVNGSQFTNFTLNGEWIEPTENSYGQELYAKSLERRYDFFNRISIWNDFQFGESLYNATKTGVNALHSHLSSWKGNLPRDKYELNRTPFAANRILGQYALIKFSKDPEVAKEDEPKDSKAIINNIVIDSYSR